MATPLVESVASIAHRGLYLTGDMFASAEHLLHTRLEVPARKMHLSQPHTTDFEQFSEIVSDVHQSWCSLVANSSGLSSEEYFTFGRMLMAASDLSLTPWQISNGVSS